MPPTRRYRTPRSTGVPYDAYARLQRSGTWAVALRVRATSENEAAAAVAAGTCGSVSSVGACVCVYVIGEKNTANVHMCASTSVSTTFNGGPCMPGEHPKNCFLCRSDRQCVLLCTLLQCVGRLHKPTYYTSELAVGRGFSSKEAARKHGAVNAILH